MSEQAKAFLDRWEKAHIPAVEYSAHKQLIPQVLASCVTEASKEGILMRELDAAAGGSLKRHITTALERARDGVVKR